MSRLALSLFCNCDRHWPPLTSVSSVAGIIGLCPQGQQALNPCPLFHAADVVTVLKPSDQDSCPGPELPLT